MERTHPKFTIETAVALALERHRTQLDKQGLPYKYHLFAVMNQLKGELSRMAGVMHDIVEDTPTTLEELRCEGCPEIVVDAIDLLTHKSPKPSVEEYFEDIKRIAASGNQIAIDVKWADLTHNSDRTRVPNPTPRDIKRWEKYAVAKEILKPLISEYLRS